MSWPTEPLRLMIEQVGDHQLLLRSLKDSPYSPTFKDDIFLWERRLASLQKSLQRLNR